MEKGEHYGPIIKTRGTHEEKAIEVIKENYSNHLNSLDEEKQAFLKENEQEKSKEQLAILDFVNDEATELMKKHSIEPYRIPHENYHLIPEEKYHEILGLSASASANAEIQGIVFKHEEYKDNLFLFGRTAFHETLHLLAQSKLETSEEGFRIYRQGVSISTLEKDFKKYGTHEHFKGLHEAIVAKSEVIFSKKLLQHPLLKKEREWVESEEFLKRRKEMTKKHILNEEEISWFNKEDKDFRSISYVIHQRLLDYICEEIQKELPEKYENSEEVFSEFQKAHFTGKIFNIARITEKTFGKGTFRSLGDVDAQDESASRKLEEFTKLRKIKNNQTTKNIPY